MAKKKKPKKVKLPYETYDNKTMAKKTKDILEGKCEYTIIVLKQGRDRRYKTYETYDKYKEALREKEKLTKGGFIAKIIHKEDNNDNKHESIYISEYNGILFATKGINRTLEYNTRQYKIENNIPIEKRINSTKDDTILECSGYMAFGYSRKDHVFHCTRMYDTEEEAFTKMNNKHAINKDTIDIIDLYRLESGKYCFSREEYEQYNRIKQVKVHKLVEHVGKKEAEATLMDIDKRRKEIRDSKRKAKEMCESINQNNEDKKDLVFDPIIDIQDALLSELYKHIIQIQKDLNYEQLSLFELNNFDNKVIEAKVHNSSAMNNAIKAQEVMVAMIKRQEQKEKQNTIQNNNIIKLHG